MIINTNDIWASLLFWGWREFLHFYFTVECSLVSVQIYVGSYIWNMLPQSGFVTSCHFNFAKFTKFIKSSSEVVILVFSTMYVFMRASLFLDDFHFYFNTFKDEPNSILCVDSAVVLWVFILWPIMLIWTHLDFFYHLMRGVSEATLQFWSKMWINVFMTCFCRP